MSAKKNDLNPEAIGLIIKMKADMGFQKDKELADFFDVKQGTLGGWKRRGVPEDKLEMFCEKVGITANELRKEGNEMAESQIVEMFLQLNAKMERIDAKIDLLAGDCRGLHREIDSLKKSSGEVKSPGKKRAS